MTKEELMKKAHTNVITEGYAPIKHYSMNKETIKKHEKKFKNRMNDDSIDRKWPSSRDAKEKNQEQAEKANSMKRLDKWSHNDNAINGVAARNYE